MAAELRTLSAQLFVAESRLEIAAQISLSADNGVVSSRAVREALEHIDDQAVYRELKVFRDAGLIKKIGRGSYAVLVPKWFEGCADVTGHARQSAGANTEGT